MKRIRIVFLLFFIVLVSISSVKAGVHPPSPQNARSANMLGDESEGPPPPDFEMPIDTNIVFLLVAGLVLGTTVVYRHKIKKASM
ncbi:hypothetical protein [Flavobacterium sp. KBS0721]|uniref:hypothetical protein n=1 Tax=Flavobacterium sp. KBS0721 TaxID=1179672 RepID=UPI000F4FD896|nr:hypothetical protein [Flavobacterium sp. KBS0721]QDW19172.1 hypothetical protein B0M43_0003310 [Flavobacterium sp. KBS0721]